MIKIDFHGKPLEDALLEVEKLIDGVRLNKKTEEAEFIINDRGKYCEIGLTLTPFVNETPTVRAVVGYIDDKETMEIH